MKKLSILFIAFFCLASFAFAAGQQDAAGADTASAAAEEEKMAITMVTDVGGVNDQSFNQSAWEGLQKVKDDLDVDISYKESKQNADYAPNMENAVDGENDSVDRAGRFDAEVDREPSGRQGRL